MASRTLAGVALAVLALAGCRSADVKTEPAPAPDARPAPPPPDASALPSGTLVEVELEQEIDTGRSRVGDRFTATLQQDVVAQDGAVVLPRGARVHGVITGVDASDRVGDEALVRLHFERLSIGARSYPFDAEIVDADVATEGEEEGRAAGAAARPALGAVLSGAERDERLRGAALGAGAGTVIYLGAGEVEACLPEGSDLTLRTTRTVPLR